jgi:SAM-dependent methyltransferase
VLADAARMPFREGEFDLVVAYMSVHDVDGMTDAVGEAARVLQPAGRLCLAIPHPLNTAGDFAGRDPAAPFVIADSYLDEHPAPWVRDKDGSASPSTASTGRWSPTPGRWRRPGC